MLESSGSLLKKKTLLGIIPRLSDSTGLGCGATICISNKLPGDTDAGGADAGGAGINTLRTNAKVF